MKPTYSELNTVLRALLKSHRETLNGNFVGTYLQGSFAVGAFDQHSDLDFIAVTEEELSDEQVDALQMVHERIYQLESPWAQHLEGSYFPKCVLKYHTQSGQDLWYLDHGARSLIRSDHCNTIVVRWVVREKGIALTGPLPETLVDPISPDLLRADILETINEWGQDILNDPDHFNNRFYQGFIVLNYCRMLHDLHTGANGSKRAGAEWAKANLDTSWSGLIDRAWDCRPDPATSVRQPADPEDFASTLEFVRLVIDRSRGEARTRLN